MIIMVTSQGMVKGRDVMDSGSDLRKSDFRRVFVVPSSGPSPAFSTGRKSDFFRGAFTRILLIKCPIWAKF